MKTKSFVVAPPQNIKARLSKLNQVPPKDDQCEVSDEDSTKNSEHIRESNSQSFDLSRDSYETRYPAIKQRKPFLLVKEL